MKRQIQAIAEIDRVIHEPGRLMIAALLFDTAPTDPAAFTGMVILLGAAALLAGFLQRQRLGRLGCGRVRGGE